MIKKDNILKTKLNNKNNILKKLEDLKYYYDELFNIDQSVNEIKSFISNAK